MLSNATYNLMEMATVLSKGLYRYATFKKDSQGCQRCEQLWDHMRRQDEEQLGTITSHLREHFEHEHTTKGKAA